MSVKNTLAALDREIARANDLAGVHCVGRFVRGKLVYCTPATCTGDCACCTRRPARNPTLRCDMVAGCNRPVAAVDEKGFVYCDAHGTARRDSGIRCRKMRPSEIAALEQGGTISYRVRRNPEGAVTWADLDRAEVARTAKYREESPQWSRKIPDRGFCIAISRSQGYEGCFLTKAAALRAGQLLADAKRETVTLIQVQGHGNDRFMAGEIEPRGRR